MVGKHAATRMASRSSGMVVKRSALFMAFVLASCATPPKPTVSVCLTLPQYTDQQKADLKAVYDAASAGSPLRWVVEDYLKVRNEAREACPK